MKELDLKVIKNIEISQAVLDTFKISVTTYMSNEIEIDSKKNKLVDAVLTSDGGKLKKVVIYDKANNVSACSYETTKEDEDFIIEIKYKILIYTKLNLIRYGYALRVLNMDIAFPKAYHENVIVALSKDYADCENPEEVIDLVLDTNGKASLKKKDGTVVEIDEDSFVDIGKVLV